MTLTVVGDARQRNCREEDKVNSGYSLLDDFFD